MPRTLLPAAVPPDAFGAFTRFPVIDSMSRIRLASDCARACIVPLRVDVIDPGRWLAGTRGAADAAAGRAAGLALLAGTMAPPRVVAAGVAFLFGLAAAFFFGLAVSATGRFLPPFTPLVFVNLVTAAFAAPIVRESARSLPFSLRRLRVNSLYLLLAALAGAFGVRAGLAAGFAAAGVAFFALGFRAGFSAGFAAAGLAVFFAAGFVAFFAGFSLPATGRLAPPLTPLVFSNRVTAALAAPAARASLHILLSLAAALARDFSSLYLSFAALAGAFDVLPGRAPPAPLTVGLLALVARVAVVAAVSGRLLRTVPEEANRPLASRFNCLAMPTPVLFL